MRTTEIVPIVGDSHEDGTCNGSYCALGVWHGRCFNAECGKDWTWHCWQKSCVEAWAERHAGCHVDITQGLAS